MFRFRRYRVFVIFAILTVLGLHHLRSHAGSVDYLRDHLQFRYNVATPGKKPAQQVFRGSPASPAVVGNPKNSQSYAKAPIETPPPVKEPEKPKQNAPPPKTNADSKKEKQVGKDGSSPESGASTGSDRFAVDGDGRMRVMPNPIPANSFQTLQPLREQGEGSWDSDQMPSDVPMVTWQKPLEHFPVAAKNVVNLPAGEPKSLPKIQAVFEEEKSEARKERVAKQEIIKEAFLHAWGGYKKHAWRQDELMPVSAGSKNPFNGWGATLVDSLDLIWMMGLTEEFEEAVEAVGKINFKTSRRSDIPVFETTIRYLGGLLGAYDVSNGKYKILLDKAVELGDIIMGAFDTPNRMPDTFYQWKPTFASQSHRASKRVVLAELGSLAVEFTRLAQLTKQPRYYDAIARITDALEEWQDRTRVPGLWPTYVDASGCVPPVFKAPSTQSIQESGTAVLDEDGNEIFDSEGPSDFSSNEPKTEQKLGKPHKADQLLKDVDGVRKGRTPGWDEIHKSNRAPQMVSSSKESTKFIPLEKPPPVIFRAENPRSKLQKRRSDDPEAQRSAEQGPSDGLSTNIDAKGNTIPANIPPKKHDNPPIANLVSDEEEICQPQGLQSSSKYGTDDYTLGSMADSTYEYFPKMFLLLNGLVGQYKTMYEKAMDVAKEKLLFRVMHPTENREVLVGGIYKVTRSYNSDEKETVANYTYELETEGSHLSCFAGGMFALGSKLFNRKGDMDIAAKLTDGCIWAYEITATGIMPETFSGIPCANQKNCAWNETKWWEELDPHPEWREQSYQSQMEVYREQVKAREEEIAEARRKKTATYVQTAMTATETSIDHVIPENTPMPTPETEREASFESASDLNKRFNLAKRRQSDVTPKLLDGEDIEGSYQSLMAKDRETHDSHKIERIQELDSMKIAKIEDHDKKLIEAARAADRPTRTVANNGESAWTPPPTATEDEYPPIWSPEKPQSHKELVKSIIEEDRLPPGIKAINDRRYILRPEALESVFYMHRLTGSPYWRKKGWNMVSAILRHTRTPLAHSGIDDVTKTTPKFTDSMESFWLAETLKYAWLLFEDEERWSLDQWVFNTEAHPLRRTEGPFEMDKAKEVESAPRKKPAAKKVGAAGKKTQQASSSLSTSSGESDLAIQPNTKHPSSSSSSPSTESKAKRPGTLEEAKEQTKSTLKMARPVKSPNRGKDVGSKSREQVTEENKNENERDGRRLPQRRAT